MNKKATEAAVELEKLDLRSHEIAADKATELLYLFPEIRTEGGKIDFDRLKRVLGETADPGKERYGMTWPGKADCFKTIQQPSLATLRPCSEESVNFDTTENLIIEGDNLEVLKLLQKSYIGKIKMIYIDPPYNTGNDFIYPDNYAESLQTYLEYTDQVDDQGKKFSTNTDTDGRFHSKWLNMMYPRLYLAKNLLRDDGIIFVSIDENEIISLRILMNEIFGEEAFLGQFIWHSKKGGGGDVKTVVSEHEYICAYVRADPEDAIGKQLLEAPILDMTDEKGPFRKGRELNKWGAGSARADRPTMFFPIPGPNGEDVFPIRNDGSEGRWRMGKPAMLKIVEKGNALFEKRADGSFIVYEKIRSTEPRKKSYRTLLTDVGSASEGTATLKDLFNGKSPLDFPKPVRLIQHLLKVADTLEDDIVLDFFAGSGTTAQALLELNQEDSGNRKFILVQLPEPTDKPDFKTISEITKERIRRVIKKLDDSAAGKLSANEEPTLDRGFMVFKLAESNFKPWQSDVLSGDTDALAKQLEFHASHLREGRTQADILYEILLKSGFPLPTKVEKITLCGKAIYSVAEGAMLICLDDALTHELIKAMADRKPERVICLDEGFAGNDQLKTNAVQTMKARGVTSFKTV